MATTRIGFVADTHGRKDDGSDLPQQCLDALAGVDLIVHLGDVGKDAILDRLRTVAPVQVPVRGKGEVIDAGGLPVGITFDITKLGIATEVNDDSLTLSELPLAQTLTKGFGQPLTVVAFGGTHKALRSEADGVLWFNPGSPTLPSDKQDDDDLGSVAVLKVSDGKASVELIRLKK